jgi:hypothetical protein
MTFVTRIKNIMITPQEEWPVIAEEPFNMVELYTGYIMPLAAIGPVALFLSSVILRRDMAFATGLGFTLVLFVMHLVTIFLAGLVTAKVAPWFGGVDDRGQGTKLVAYASTAAWLGGVFNILPWLSILSLIFSLFSLYLLYTGAATMMRVGQEKSLSFTATAVVILIIITLAIYWLAGSSLR